MAFLVVVDFLRPVNQGGYYQGDRSRETSTIAGFRYTWVQEGARVGVRGGGRYLGIVGEKKS